MPKLDILSATAWKITGGPKDLPPPSLGTMNSLVVRGLNVILICKIDLEGLTSSLPVCEPVFAIVWKDSLNLFDPNTVNN